MLPWGKFWRLLDQLGADSRYSAAQQNDPELARKIAEDTAEGKTWHPDAADWTLMHDLVAEVRDLLADSVVIQGRGLPSNGRRQFPSRYPRPVTEIDKARAAAEAARDQLADERIMAEVDRAKQRWRDQQAELQREMAEAVAEEDTRPL